MDSITELSAHKNPDPPNGFPQAACEEMSPYCLTLAAVAPSFSSVFGSIGEKQI